MFTIKIRQKISNPVEPIEGLDETRAQLSVARMIMPNSTPYIRRRPNALGQVSLVVSDVLMRELEMKDNLLSKPTKQNHADDNACTCRGLEGLVHRVR